MPQGPSGDIRGFDAHTGEQRWRFHTVPRPGEFGHETWEGDSWKNRGGVNAWSIITTDEENGLAFVPLTSPSTDYYGGDRRGDNLFSDSLVALDCQTGQRRWHFQTIHHDLWDWDLPGPPNVIEVVRDGKKVPAVTAITKTGFVYVFNRLTGKPLFPIEERPVPQGDIPGEYYSPTQPVPVKPPPVARQSMTRDEITAVTPESRAECLEMVEGRRYRRTALPPPCARSLRSCSREPTADRIGAADLSIPRPTPSTSIRWTSALFSGSSPAKAATRPGATAARCGDASGTRTSILAKSPLGPHLTAIDLNSGEFRWRVVLGEIDELTKRGVPKTGTSNLGGSIVTKGGLVFIGATNDDRFRAFDKDTGKQLWETRLPASAHATPMTYMGRDGRQYVAIAAGGGNKYNKKYGGKLVVFSLPEE